MTPPTILNALGSRQLREASGSGPWSWSRNAATTAKPALLLRITLRGGFCFSGLARSARLRFFPGGRSGSVRVSGRDRRSEERRRLPARCPARASARAPDHDRHRLRDREAGADDPARIRFMPAILPPYARRSKSLDTLIPILYLRRVDRRLRAGRWPPCSARMLLACRPQPSRGRRTSGSTNTSDGASATCWPRATSTSGPTASWSSSAPCRRARRSCSALSQTITKNLR